VAKNICISTKHRNRLNSETCAACIALELTPVFGGVYVSQSFVFCVVFCRSLLVLLLFDHCVICLSSIYGFWLPLCYLQTLLSASVNIFVVTFLYGCKIKTLKELHNFIEGTCIFVLESRDLVIWHGTHRVVVLFVFFYIFATWSTCTDSFFLHGAKGFSRYLIYIYIFFFVFFIEMKTFVYLDNFHYTFYANFKFSAHDAFLEKP